MDKNELPDLCKEIDAPNPERDLFAISNYFSQACAVGQWVPEKDYDAKLRTAKGLLYSRFKLSYKASNL